MSNINAGQPRIAERLMEHLEVGHELLFLVKWRDHQETWEWASEVGDYLTPAFLYAYIADLKADGDDELMEDLYKYGLIPRPVDVPPVNDANLKPMPEDEDNTEKQQEEAASGIQANLVAEAKDPEEQADPGPQANAMLQATAKEVYNVVPAENDNNAADNEHQEEEAALLNNKVDNNNNAANEPVLTDKHYDINGLLDHRVKKGRLEFYADWTEYSPDWQYHKCFLPSTLSDYYNKLVEGLHVKQFAELRTLLAQHQARFVPSDRQYEDDLSRVLHRLGQAIVQLGHRRCQDDAEQQALQSEIAKARRQHDAAGHLYRTLLSSKNQRQQDGGSRGRKRSRGNVSTLNSKRRKN